MSAVPSVISGHGINFSFGEDELQKQILFDVSLQIQPGEIVLLTGPSGSGKTTLLTLIAGLRSMQQGTLTVLGHALHQATYNDLIQLRRKIGFIFQAHNLLPFLTAACRTYRSCLICTRTSIVRKPGDVPLPCWGKLDCRTELTIPLPNCQAGSDSEWPWPEPWSLTRSWSLRMNPPRPSTV